MWSEGRRHGKVLLALWPLLAILLCCDALAVHYSSGECEGEALGARESALSCSLRTLDQELRVANLTTAPLDSVTRLSLVCSDVYYFQSALSPSALKGFARLRALSVEFCKISELEDNAFAGLRNLRNLTLRTHNSDWPVMSLTAKPQVFRPLHQLERLDLSTNNIWELPGGAFCHLANLKLLNLSQNHLQDITQLGFGPSSPSDRGSASSSSSSVISSPASSSSFSSCRSDISSLDLSHNDVTVLVSGSLQGLEHLQQLHLQHNELGKVDDNAFLGLRSLQSLDLSDNRLVALPEHAFLHTPGLMYCRARNNSLSMLAPGLFRGLEHLVELDLSYNELKSEWLTSSIFQGLVRLMLLDLSHNKISQLNQQVFRDLYTVQVLRLSHNQLRTVPAASFAACVNLHTLDLSYNQLTSVPDRAFQGLSVLSFLALDNNQIVEVGASSLRNLSSLEDLNLNGNRLTSVPEAVAYLRYLKTLDLGENQIAHLAKMPVKGLQFLYGLRLVNNRISGNISKDTFSDIPALKILNLAKNSITAIERGTFDSNRNLQAIRIDANKLNSISGLFESLPNLLWLNVSDNNIEVFDYHFIPPSLEWLDLHKNRISELGNYLERHDLNLQTLDASYNNLRYINNSIQIPDSIQLLFLNDNKISAVEPFTFFKKKNLTRVDLFDNQLSRMDMSALRLTEVPTDKSLPEVYLGGNPFVCDCDMEWLQRINSLEHRRQYPTLMDLESIYCQMPFARTGAFTPLVEVKPSQFLCQYETHCFALCHCCEYDACDCEMTCPEGCGCYHDQSWRTNIVDCALHDLQQVPDRIPMDATEVYLDGNDLRNLSSHSFIGRKHLQVLFVNSSNVKALDNETFSGLTRLTTLHLEDNYLEALRGNEFQGLSVVTELYLHNNRLRYIHQHTFVTLLRLEVLTLHGNELINFPVWRLVDNPYLSRVSLSANQWSCQCQFVESFGIWLNVNERKVTDGREIKCYAEEEDEPASYIMDFNVTTCMNSSSSSTVMRPMALNNLLHPVIATCVAFIVVVILLLCFVYRGTIRVWIYSQCGYRMCHKNASSDDRDKLFDAFVSYSSKDEAWVNQVLAGELERGDRPYRVCLHYRDFPVTAYIAETIVEAVESSRRTIIVLSKNFIENEWCRFQFKSAHHEVLKKRRQRLIVIVLGEIPARDLDPDLRLYLKTNTCIHASDKFFWEKLRFAMPDVQNSQRVVHTYSSIPERSSSSGNKYSVNSPVSMHHNLHGGSDAYWA